MVRKLRIVSIGSKSSAGLIVKGFPEQQVRISAICPTTDTGSSTGVIRKNFSIPAPGDLRTIMSLFSDLKGGDRVLKELFEYRFQPSESGDLQGMALGNLIIAALTEVAGSFQAAIEAAAGMLKVKGSVLPMTLANTELCARLIDGTTVTGEVEVRKVGKPAVERVYLRDEARTTRECRLAIQGADLICLGPGCLYTSLIPCLLVKGIPEALKRAKGRVVYICNHTTTPGQTDGFTVLKHLQEVKRYLPGVSPDYCLVTDRMPPAEMLKVCRDEMISFILPTKAELLTLSEMGIEPITGDFIERGWKGKRSLHKVDTIRHDPVKVRKALLGVYYGT